MDKGNKKAKEVILAYFKATKELIDISMEVGSESGVYRLFDSGPTRSLSLNLAEDEFKVISLEEWKKRNDV